MLSVNERTVYRMAQRAEFPEFKVAGTWRFLEQDIMAWIERQKKEVGSRTGSRSKGGGDASQ